MLFTYLAWQLKKGLQDQPVDASNDKVSVLVVSLDIGSTLLPVVSTSGILYNFEMSRQLWGFCQQPRLSLAIFFFKSHFTSVVEQHWTITTDVSYIYKAASDHWSAWCRCIHVILLAILLNMCKSQPTCSLPLNRPKVKQEAQFEKFA